jgi:hypothetical protein
MRRSLLIPAAVIGLAFPAGLGLAVYSASGSSLAPPDATARVPTGEIARPSVPPATTTDGTSTDRTTTAETTTDDTTTEETTTVEETTTDDDDDSGRGRGRGRGRSGSGSGDD